MASPPSPEIQAFALYCRTRRGLRPATVAAYTSDLALLAAHGLPLAPPATTEAIEHALNRYVAASHAKPTRLRRLTMTLRSFYAWAVAIGRMQANPASALTNPRPAAAPVHVLSLDEALAVDRAARPTSPADVAATRTAALVALMLWAGLRVGEVVAILPPDLLKGQQHLAVRGKGGKPRTVPLAPRALPLLDAWALLRSPASAWFFHGPAGSPLSPRAVQRTVSVIGRKAGLSRPLSPHVLRRSYATILYAEGAGVVEIQQLLGHASLATTQLYTHTTPARLAGAVALFPA